LAASNDATYESRSSVKNAVLKSANGSYDEKPSSAASNASCGSAAERRGRSGRSHPAESSVSTGSIVAWQDRAIGLLLGAHLEVFEALVARVALVGAD
jgi:hypothetical protein